MKTTKFKILEKLERDIRQFIRIGGPEYAADPHQSSKEAKIILRICRCLDRLDKMRKKK